jgi:hypothetical protein
LPYREGSTDPEEKPMLRKILFGLMVPAFLVAIAHSPAFAAGYDFAKLADPGYRVPLRSFPSCCAQPEWWSNVQGKPIRSIKDLYAIWQDAAIPKPQKAKSFFQAIRDFNRGNDEIVAAAIALYPNVDKRYPDLIPLLEYGVGEYFHYDNSNDHYNGSRGDRAAGLVRHLARQYRIAGRHEEAVKVLAAFMAEREADANGHLQQLTSLDLATSLDALGRTAEADSLLAHALSAYEGSWNKKIGEQRTAFRERLTLVERFSASYLPYVLLAGVLLLSFGAFTAFRRRHA